MFETMAVEIEQLLGKVTRVTAGLPQCPGTVAVEVSGLFGDTRVGVSPVLLKVRSAVRAATFSAGLVAFHKNEPFHGFGLVVFSSSS